MLHRKAIIKKSIQIGFLTQISRILGVVRELLIIQYLGVGTVSDAFITAFKVPNSLRKIFAEGALSAALVPSIVKESDHHNQRQLMQFITAAFIFFEILCFTIVLCGMYYSQTIIQWIAPGFHEAQQQLTGSFLFILLPSILFFSISSLFASALQAKGKFTIPALGPAIFNTAFLVALGICLYFKIPVHIFCLLILLSALVQCIIHMIAYFYHGFYFCLATQTVLPALKGMIGKFLLCLPPVGFSEINLFIDTTFASLLGNGAISLIYYANRFMGIPLGVVIGSLTTVLLPQLSHVALKSRKRLSFYIFESIKIVLLVTLPVTILMMLTSYHLFYTIFLSESFTLEQVKTASTLLQAFCIGLPFLALNRLFLNVLYAMHKTVFPACISAIAVAVNIGGNMLFIHMFKIVGLALATSLSALVQMILFIIALRYYKCAIPLKKTGIFLIKYVLLLSAVGLPLLALYFAFTTLILESLFAPLWVSRFGFWYIAVPFGIVYTSLVWVLRRRVGLYLFFID